VTVSSLAIKYYVEEMRQAALLEEKVHLLKSTSVLVSRTLSPVMVPKLETRAIVCKTHHIVIPAKAGMMTAVWYLS
jgi:hypothetical protein